MQIISLRIKLHKISKWKYPWDIFPHFHGNQGGFSSYSEIMEKDLKENPPARQVYGRPVNANSFFFIHFCYQFSMAKLFVGFSLLKSHAWRKMKASCFNKQIESLP